MKRPPDEDADLVRALARELEELTNAEAAALAAAGSLALRAARLTGARPCDRVMVTGASSETGAIAVQIVKARGGHVTAVCRDRDVPLVWDLGADVVLADERDPGSSGPFAAVIDTDASVTPEIAEHLLDPDGRLVAIREGALHVSSADGSPLADHSGEIALDELVELVERDGVFPVRPRR